MGSLHGLYGVTPDITDTTALAQRVAAAIRGGMQVLQYRNKTASDGLRHEQARVLRELCRTAGVTFIINDHLDLALAVDADGLHIGGDDGDVASARQALGNDRILGVSCYDRLELGMEACAAGADYIAFGSFFPSGIKPNAVRPPLALLVEARRACGVPIVAIGGITPENAPQLIAAGADAVAVISALFAVPDPAAAAREFVTLFGLQRT